MHDAYCTFNNICIYHSRVYNLVGSELCLLSVSHTEIRQQPTQHITRQTYKRHGHVSSSQFECCCCCCCCCRCHSFPIRARRECVCVCVLARNKIDKSGTRKQTYMRVLYMYIRHVYARTTANTRAT